MPDGSLAFVTAAQKIDPADRTRVIPDDTVSVIDLKASPPAVLTTLRAGAGASGVSVNRTGTLALVANRMEGTVSVFTINGRTVVAAGKVDLGAPQSGPSAVVFTQDGRTALVTRNNDSLISILSVDGAKVAYTKRDIGAGFKPYGIEIAGDVAIVGNIGAGTTGGGIDVVNVIDLAGPSPRAIAHLPAGPTVEGVSISPDGRYVAATVMNGSNSPKGSPAFNDFAILKVYSLAEQGPDARCRNARRTLVPGIGVEPRREDRPRAMRRRTGDPGIHVRRQGAEARGADQGQRRSVGDSDELERSFGSRLTVHGSWCWFMVLNLEPEPETRNC